MRQQTIRLLTALITLLLCAAIHGADTQAASNKTVLKKPVLTKIVAKQTGKKSMKAVLHFKGAGKGTYIIYRKEPNSLYQPVKTVTLKGTNGVFTDMKLKTGRTYVYTVQQLYGKKKGPYDKAGIRVLPSPSVSAAYSNKSTAVNWSTVEGADGYYLYRKCASSWKKIADTSDQCYNDMYINLDKNTKRACRNVYAPYLDPSYNKLSYTVRAYRVRYHRGKKKVSLGSYLPDGVYYLERPTIISISKKSKGSRILTWGCVPHADKYRIYLKSGSKWKRYTDIAAVNGQTQSLSVPADSSGYTVRALAKRNGVTVRSSYENSFMLTCRNKDNRSILFAGDSIMRGQPYNGSSEKGLYSIPQRVSALTGASCINLAAPSACITFVKGTARSSILKDQILTWDAETLAGFDIIVLEGGTNDYYLSRPLLPQNESEPAQEGDELSLEYGCFDGAVNALFDHIEEAGKLRVKNGRAPVRVIWMDLTFSNRLSADGIIQNRDVTPNKLNYTLQDYQAVITAACKARQSPYMEISRFKTRSYGILTEENCSFWSTDDLHLTKKAYAEYGSALTQFMLSRKIL